MIRLLELGARNELILKTFEDGANVPPYAILSHTWERGGEITFTDLQRKDYKDKAGYQKICFCGTQARKDEIQFFWVDTCCINKDSHSELSEAITSMFRWYHEAVKCYVYLSDISAHKDGNNQAEKTWKSAFRKAGVSFKRQTSNSRGKVSQVELKTDFCDSRWFTRGWTLQELIAPRLVEFFSREGDLLGTKRTLEQQIHKITQIPIEALRGASLSGFSVDERLQWAQDRQTTRKEDKAYCLFGIFNVFLPLIYGEGDNAFVRLQEAIDHRPPLVSFTVPFRRDSHFVDRPDLLARMHEHCSVPGARTAVVGLGGVGKSQLAIEFCYRVRDATPQTWIFWVHASNADRFRQGYSEIAKTLQLPGWKDPKADSLSLVHDWLHNDRNGKWLLVLDNVDDATFLVDRSNQSVAGSANDPTKTNPRCLMEFVPISQNGSVLISSRTKEAALKLVEADDVIEVNPMEEESAVTLIGKKLQSKAERKDMAQLAETLEYMPLAMVQAASYIAERWPRCSIPQYITDFEKNDNSRTSLLNYEAGQLRRDRDAKNSIIITWQISFDHIHNIRRSAADLLSLMSFFDRQDIPEMALYTPSTAIHIGARQDSEATSKDEGSIVEGAEGGEIDRESDVIEGADDGIEEYSKETGPDDEKRFNDEVERQDYEVEERGLSNDEDEIYTRSQFEEDILLLRQFSFVSLSTSGDTFEMHTLVQLATRRWLEAHGQIEDWQCKYISMLYSVMPTGKYENWEICRILFPHVKTTLTQQPRDSAAQEKWSGILMRAAYYADEMGNISDMEIMARMSMEVRQKLFGSEHEDTLKSMNMVGLAYHSSGRCIEAKELLVKVLETCKRLFGAEHPSTLGSMNNVAFVLDHLCKYTEAEQMYRKVAEVEERVWGKEDPSALMTINNLANVLSRQGRHCEAEQMYRRILEIKERVLSKEHPSTLKTIGSLAVVLRTQEKYVEAEQLLRDVLEVEKRTFGAEHPTTLSSISNLARTLLGQGRCSKAKQMLREVWEIQKRVLGEENPATLATKHGVASALAHQGRYLEAEQIYREVLETYIRTLGEEHPDTMTSMHNLAHALKRQDKYAEALQLAEQCLGSQSRVLDIDHPDTQGMSKLLAEWRLEALDVGSSDPPRE